MTREWSALKPRLAEVYEQVHAVMCKQHLRVQFWWVSHEENKKADGTYRAACAAGETVVVLDNTGLLLGAGNIVTCLVAH